ncbi:GSCOCG00005195001-RA-CDS [Cotesia congregata]|nr:GSCOCG00005195001-RA-CDS [Cotesia congregata]
MLSICWRDLNYTLCSENNTCACLENYTVVDGYCRGLIEAKCFNDLDCAVENSVCKAGLCQCPTDFYLSTNKTKCYPYARELGDFCESSIGCRDLKYTDCVGKNQCDCLPNYTVIEGHCKALIGSNCSEDFDCIVERSVCKLNICQCSDDEYLSANRERCYPYAKNLNDFCEDNAGCRDLKYSQCVENNKCVCLDHYIQVDDYCRGLIEANCSNNSDCAVDHSYCDESDTCRCFDNFYQSENRGECYSLAQKIGDFCETNIGCRELEFTDCFENKCVCLSNYTEVDDRCRGVINAKCFKNSDCATKNSVCEANTCRCSVGFYLSTDRTQCHPLAKQINDFCETEFGCRDLRFTNCSTDKKCVCLQNYTKIDDSCRGFIHENCFDASDCAAKNSICKSNTCQCPDDFYLSADERKCHPFAKEINDFCETDFACHDLKFTSCSALNKCTCLPTHIVINGHCRGLINAKCFKYSDCATENSVCESSTCQCSDDFYLSLDEKRCYQFAKHVNDFCETHISCRNLKFTSCSQNNKCTCLSTHLEINRHCRGVMGSSCFENDDCAAINAICDKSKTCQCPPELYRSRTELECYPFANRYNDFCEIDIGCRNLKYTHCSEDYRCICSQNYTEIDGRCSGLINASCSEDPDCAIANSICSESNTCQCLNDFYLSSSKETCIHYAEKIHDFCEDDSSCRNVPFTYCSVNNKCACLPNYSQIDDNCRAPINESCSNNSQCSAENSICESNICQCGVDFYLSENQDKCHPYAQQLENSCETELGCRNLKYTYCSEHGCVCIKNYIVVNGHCRGLISVKCSDDSDCAVGYSYCDESNTCQCPADHYLLVEEDKCYPYAKQLHDFCENDDSCYNLNFSTCFENKCICPANYTAIDGNCRGFNGAQCYGSSDCVARNSICQSSFCQCPQDFYLSESQKECYQYAKNLHDFCENDIGCYNLNFSICFENKCICPANYTVIDGNCRGFNGAKCYKNSDCVAGNSICELSFCQCPQNSYLSENRKECYQYAKNLHDFCETDENCYDINFSYCYEGKCSCIINYVEINGSCLGLIDSKCSDYSECAAENSICNREACQCSTNFYPSVNNDTCYKYAEKLGDVCEMNAGCRNLNFTFCSEDYQCICSESYIVVNESCRGLNEAKCNENLDCAAKNSICDQSSTCQCPIDRYLSADKRKCYSYARQLSDFCEYDGGCRELNFTKCSESQRCSCAEGYLDIDGRCKGLIRANCFEDSDCAVEKSICHLGNCQCPNDYYLSENGNKCYLYAKQLNTFCETDLSCRDFKYSYCSENNICACLENYTVVDGYCRGLIEAKCFNDLDCAVENSVCKAGLCQCPTDFYLSTNKTKCYPYARELGDFCESSIGCRDLKYTDCVGKNQCDCLPNYTVIEGHCKALIGSNCSEDFDCVVERSVCKLNICQCSDDEYLSANRERCYPYAKNLNDFCEDNAGCRDLKYSQCVENNKCVCLDHYIQVDDYCRGLIEANCSNNSDCAVDHSYCDESDTCRCFDNFYQSENRGECYSLAQKIGDFCETNIGCRELEFTDCFENKCVCLSNYTEVDDRCRGVINAKCFKDSDCATKNSVCEANTCRCSVGFYLSTDRTQCHPLAKQINDFCETEFGCRDLRFTNCSTDKKCVCLQNYTEIDDSCRGFIHAKCFEASDCAAENSICKSNTCQCPDDFNLSSDERKCHPFAKEMHDFCDTDLSCRDLRFTFCSENNKCTCLPNYTIVNEHCRGLIGSKCFNDSDCALTNSVCHSNACQCRTGFYASESKNNCHRYAKQFGAFCENDNACRNILYTHCSKDNRCVCNTSYVLIDNHCQGFIGANCSKDSDCAFEYSFCDKKICKCRDDFYLSINGQRCYAYAERINEFCDSDMGCRYLNYSFCSKNNKCVCVPNYTPVDELCRGLNGAECSKDLDCALNNSACKDNTCQCLPDFYLSKTEEKCYQYAKQLNDFCETDDACRDLKFTHCFENKCTCLPNYEAINGHCRGLVGSKCSETSDCLLNFSTCKFNECQCSDEFYFSPSSQKCISFAKNLNDFCETDDTCRNIKFSYCNKNKQCTCLPNYIGENDYCRGLIDENCIKDSDCAVENSICSSNVCQCSVDHYPSTNKENCFKYASNIDDYCEDNEGCRKIKHSFCSNNKNCTCFSPYKENEGKCLGVFNASCYDDSDCDSFYQCSSNRCLCRDGFTFDDYYKCISVNRYLGESCIDNDYCRGIEHSSCDSDFRCTCATNYFNVNGSCLHYMGTCCLKDSNCGIKNSVCERYHCQCKKNYFFHPFYLECQKK